MTDVNPFDALDAQATPEELAALDVFRKKQPQDLSNFWRISRQQQYFKNTTVGHSMANNEQAGWAANVDQADSNLSQWEDMSFMQKAA